MRLPSALILTTALLAACSTSSAPQHVGIDWGTAPCPAPAPQSISATHHLIMERGKTLKCQIRPYVSNMACQGVVDGDDDAFLCQNAAGQQSVFVFNAQGILTEYRSLK